MKKRVGKIIVAAVAVLMLFSFSSCENASPREEKTIQAKAEDAVLEKIKVTLEIYESKKADVNADEIYVKTGSFNETENGEWELYGMIYVENRYGGSLYSYEFYATGTEENVTQLESDLFSYLESDIKYSKNQDVK